MGRLRNVTAILQHRHHRPFRGLFSEIQQSKILARTLQDASCPATGEKKKIVDVFPGLTVLPDLVTVRVELRHGLDLLSVQVESEIADASEKSRYTVQ